MEANDVLKNAFLQSTIAEGVDIAVKAEDVQQNSGIDFSKHYFEAKVGSTYLIKFLPNPGNNPIIHRSVYKNLPDPERKGKTFHYVSSGNAKTCKALDLFFTLFALKKDGNAVAEKKIDKYLGKTNQGCAKIQILQSPIQEEIGIVRMMTFATFGPNATVANLIDKKLNPKPEQIKQGFEKEDIFDIFESSVLSLVCVEAVYDGQKGRDFTKSDWAPKPKGAIATLPSGETHQFTKNDLVNGAVISETIPYFNAFVEQVMNDDYDIRKYFAYKEINDPRNDKDTNDYLISTQAKVDEIIPIIRDKSLTEIAAYGKASSSSAEAKPDAAKNILADSIPDELAGSVIGAATITAKNEEVKTEGKNEVDDVLNS
jgi:hypothetical protein